MIYRKNRQARDHSLTAEFEVWNPRNDKRTRTGIELINEALATMFAWE